MGTGQNRVGPVSDGLFSTFVFITLLSLVVFLQFLSGAYRGEFSGYPDEPAHYVTSVMVRDFLVSGHWNEPMRFAKDYYSHYPKVAFGHWPPLLYSIQGVWMVCFSESRASVMAELALTSAIAAFLFYLVAARYFGFVMGFCGATLLVCLPIVQVYSDEEMAESLLLLTTFQAAVFFARYLENKRWQDSLWFGVFFSLAVLTKGNGWALAIIPPVALFLTWGWKALKQLSFWIPVPVVAALCVPWQMLTLDMAQRGWTGGSSPSIAYTVGALGEFLPITRDLLGWALTTLALVGIGATVLIPLWRKQVQPLFAVMFGLWISMWFFHSLIPAGVESRKLLNAIPALMLFALAGVNVLSGFVLKFLPRLTWRGSRAIIGAAAVILFAVEIFRIPNEPHYGFTELSSYIESRPELYDSTILVSSEGDGEGLLISELMMQDRRRPGHIVLRANKLLSTSDWTGKISEQFCNNTGDVMRYLNQEGVRAVVLDSFPRRIRYLHDELIREAIREFPDCWTLKSTFGGGKIQLYEFVQQRASLTH